MISQRCVLLALAVLCLATTPAGRALAMSSQGTLGDVIFSAPRDERSGPAPMVARYVSDEGESFVLDRSSPTPLMKFRDSQEVMVLSASQASRGDIIYQNDLGEPVLRVTKLGGLTLFARGRPGGAPVALEGQASGLRMQTMSPAALLQRLTQASVRASRAAKRLIVFDAQEVTPGSEAVFADAVMVTSEAVVIIAKRREGKTVLARFGRVLFTPGARAAARVERGVIHVVLNPALGFAGRPSSARIIAACLQAR